MGAWFSVRDYIQWTLDTLNAKYNEISYIGRSPDATHQQLDMQRGIILSNKK